MVNQQELDRLALSSQDPSALLRAILSHVSKLDTDIAHARQQDEEHALQEGKIITWPTDGGIRAIAPGTMIFDLTAGRVTLPDGSSDSLSANLETLGLPFMHSVHAHMNTHLMAARVFAHPSIKGQPPTWFWFDRQHHFIHHVGILRLELITSFASNLYVEFGGEHESPVLPIGDVGIFGPYRAERTTVATFQPMLWRPASFSPVTRILTFMDEAVAIKDATLGGSVLDLAHCLNKTFFIHNTGSEDAVVRLLGLPVTNMTFAVEDSSTSGGLTVSAGSSAVLTVNRAYNQMRLEARNVAGGAATTLVAHCMGIYG